MSQGLTSAIKAGRVTRGRVCFCVPASESTSVLIYILNTVHCCFCIAFENQRAVHHSQVIRRAVQKAYYHCSRTTDYSVPYYYCCIDAGVPRANIGDQSRACETRSCLFLCPCIGVDICTDIHTEYSTHCVGFVLLLKFSELYTISKSHGRTVQKAGCHSPCTG